jgi:acetyl esterase/lipase
MRLPAGFVALLLIPLAACVPDGPNPAECRGTGTRAQRDVRYASTSGVAARWQSLDLYLPVVPRRCGATPLVVWVHGGGFVGGDKRNNVADKVSLFNREGWAFASLNYRLVGADGVGATNGMYSAPERDIAAAISYLHRHASTYRLDVRHVMLLGHSAGAFLVALESTDSAFLRGVGLELDDIVCTAPLDTTYDIPTQISLGGRSAQMYRNAFGNDPDVWERASPSRQVSRGEGIPRFHIVTRGGPGRVAQSRAFGTTLQDAGIAADVQVASGLTHEDVNDAVGQRGDTVVTPPLMAFYRRCVAT